MLARRGGGELVAQGRQRGDDLGARFARLDDLVDVTGAGGVVGIVEFLAVIFRQAFAFGGGIFSGFDLFLEQDVGRAFRAQHGDLGARPGVGDVGAEILAGHNHVRAAIGFARDDGDLGHGGFGVGVEQFCAVTDDAAMFLGDAGQEAGRIDKGDQRHVEAVAHAHEAGHLVAGVDVDHACHAGRFLCHDAHAVPADARQSDNGILRPIGLDFEESVFVHDAAG